MYSIVYPGTLKNPAIVPNFTNDELKLAEYVADKKKKSKVDLKVGDIVTHTLRSYSNSNFIGVIQKIDNFKKKVLITYIHSGIDEYLCNWFDFKEILPNGKNIEDISNP